MEKWVAQLTTVVPKSHELPKVSVIIVHYNGLGNLKRCLKSLEKTNYDNYDVTIVDNGSTDGSIDFIKQDYSHFVSLIENKENLGFAKGNNLALRMVQTKYVALLNNDTEVDPDWLIELIRVAESDSNIAAVQAKLRSLVHKDYFEYNGAAGGLLDVYGYPVCMGRVFHTAEKDVGQYDYVKDIFFAATAATLIRRCALNETGFFEDIFRSFEEIDLNWRIHMMGYKVKNAPRSVVYHLGGGTLRFTDPERWYWNHRDNIITIIKNYSGRNLLRFLPLRLFFDLLAVVFYLKQNSRFAVTPIKAHFWVLTHLRTILRKRGEIQRLRRVSDEEIFKKMVTKSVMIQYFLMRRKKYSELGGLPICQKSG